MLRPRRTLPADTDIVAYLLSLPPARRARGIEALGAGEREALDREWSAWAHAGQQSPPGDWRTWVLMGGRGFGKTLAGAQWITQAVNDGARGGRPLRIALVAASLDEARRIMVEGDSGLLRIAAPHVREWSPSRRLLRFAGGAEATLFSGASPGQLRGPEHHLAWCDELAKWTRPGETWTMLQLGLRLGARPRALVTTTPRPGPVLRGIMAEPGCVVTGGATHANPHLPRAFRETVETLYGGTRLGAQELEGKLLPDAAGALWTVELIERCRLIPPRDGEGDQPQAGGGVLSTIDALRSGHPSTACGGPPPRSGEVFSRTLIAVDPPSGAGTCGIVACARAGEGRAAIAHVLADHSVTGRSPEGWARAVAAAAAAHGTREVVAEANQGGRMVQAVLLAADPTLRVRPVHARHDKAHRAEPIAHLCEAGRVRLHGRMPELEAQLLGLIAGGGYEGPGDSPDRADAMVWGVGEVMRERGVRVVSL